MVKKTRKLKKFLGKSCWNFLLLSILVGLLWFFTEFLFVYLIQIFLYSLGISSVPPPLLSGWIHLNLDTTSSAMVFLVLFGLFKALILVFKTYVEGQSRHRFIEHQRGIFLKLGLSEHKKFSSTKLVTFFGESIPEAGTSILLLSRLIQGSIVVLALSIFAFNISAKDFMTGLCIMAILLLPIKLLNKKSKNLGAYVLNRWKKINELLIASLKNYFFLNVSNSLKKEQQKGTALIKDYRATIEKFSIINALNLAVPQTFGLIVIATITYLRAKDSSISEAEGVVLVSFFYAFTRFCQTIGNAIQQYNALKFSFPVLKEIYDFDSSHHLEKKENPIEGSSPKKPLESPLTISIENLGFAYNKNAPLFKNITCQVKTGEILLIKGPSGIGKSTLLSLLLGIYSPLQGSIRVNGQDLSKTKRAFLDQVGYVGPEPFLVDGSIRDNLVYGLQESYLPKITDQKLEESLLSAAFSKTFIKESSFLNKKISEIEDLSTGQKQRLALARAIVKNPKVLVLDEATANLDTKTEEHIINHLKTKKASVLSIVVSHKKIFDDLADQRINLS